jgi:hypothetical protein
MLHTTFSTALEALREEAQPIAIPPKHLHTIAGSNDIPHTDLSPL